MVVNDEAPMTPEEFVAWMEANAFVPDTLAAALHVNAVSVFRWKAGKHPITHMIYFALQHLAADRGALRTRRKALDDIAKAQKQARSATSAARTNALTAGIPR